MFSIIHYDHVVKVGAYGNFNKYDVQKLFNENPTGQVLKEDRLRALMGDGGIQDCSYAQNCVNACPKEVPLTRAISDVNRDALLQGVKDFFTR